MVFGGGFSKIGDFRSTVATAPENIFRGLVVRFFGGRSSMWAPAVDGVPGMPETAHGVYQPPPGAPRPGATPRPLKSQRTRLLVLAGQQGGAEGASQEAPTQAAHAAGGSDDAEHEGEGGVAAASQGADGDVCPDLTKEAMQEAGARRCGRPLATASRACQSRRTASTSLRQVRPALPQPHGPLSARDRACWCLHGACRPARGGRGCLPRCCHSTSARSGRERRHRARGVRCRGCRVPWRR